MWYVCESGDAVDLSKAISFSATPYEGDRPIVWDEDEDDDATSPYEVCAKFPVSWSGVGIPEGFLKPFDIVLKEFANESDAKKFIADLVEKLNAKNFEEV